MAGMNETRARVYWDLLQKFKGQKVTPEKKSEVAETVMDTLKKIREERQEKTDELKKDRVLIFDGLNTFIRAWAVVPEMDVNGEHIGGVTGFIRSVKSLVREIEPSRCIIVWDGEGGSKKRRGIFKEYKEGRKPKVNRQYDFETPEQSAQNLQMQYRKTQRIVDMLGMTQVEIDQVEADDVIAFICKHLMPDVDKVVVTTDKDMLQLVDSHTLVYSGTKKVYYTSDKMKETFGVLPENFVYMKAIEGDGSDNIPGIKGFGPKTINKLFPFLNEKESSLNEILEYCEQNKADKKLGKRFEQVLASKDILFRNVELMQLSSPIISAQTIGAIKGRLQKEVQEFNPSELKLSLLKDGLQIKDVDLFSVFNAYNIRAHKKQEQKE